MDPNKKVDLAKLRSISIAGSAIPTRKPEVTQRAKDQAQFTKDAAAYRRLRKDGTQPRGVDGSAELEQRAETKQQVETAQYVGNLGAGR